MDTGRLPGVKRGLFLRERNRGAKKKTMGLTLHVETSSVFGWDGNDVTCELYVT